jgi:mannan endo-1,4-beta-mannosidase
MIAIPECHSATGEWERLSTCVNFWKDPVLVQAIQENKQWTLVNIGNEVGDGTVTDAQFKAGYMGAIDSLRNWGYTVPLVIDASTWGQNVDIVFDNWKEIEEHDPLKNILFSVHSYWSSTGNYDRVADESVNNGMPVIIGEGPSPTAYPACNILDFGTGLTIAGQNDIGWLAWSWGAVNNADCVPNFDLTINGLFGNWETPYAATMMVDHPYSLMRTAERPPSFFDDGTVKVSGIYISDMENSIYEGDTVYFAVTVTPANALGRGYTLNISGDTGAVSIPEDSGMLIGINPGQITITAVGNENNSITFSRTVEIQEKIIPVTEIKVMPSQANMIPGDTIFIEVEILPDDATVREFTFEVTGDSGVIDFDEATGRVIAIKPGVAGIIARWAGGDITGETLIIVIDATGNVSLTDGTVFSMYPNPNDGLLYISCSKPLPFRMVIAGLRGELVFENNLQNQAVIDIRHLVPGFYEVVIIMEDQVIRQKLVRM